jgi:hypothetical protein
MNVSPARNLAYLFIGMVVLLIVVASVCGYLNINIQ